MLFSLYIACTHTKHVLFLHTLHTHTPHVSLPSHRNIHAHISLLHTHTVSTCILYTHTNTAHTCCTHRDQNKNPTYACCMFTTLPTLPQPSCLTAVPYKSQNPAFSVDTHPHQSPCSVPLLPRYKCVSPGANWACGGVTSLHCRGKPEGDWAHKQKGGFCPMPNLPRAAMCQISTPAVPYKAEHWSWPRTP